MDCRLILRKSKGLFTNCYERGEWTTGSISLKSEVFSAKWPENAPSWLIRRSSFVDDVVRCGLRGGMTVRSLKIDKSSNLIFKERNLIKKTPSSFAHVAFFLNHRILIGPSTCELSEAASQRITLRCLPRDFSARKQSATAGKQSLSQATVHPTVRPRGLGHKATMWEFLTKCCAVSSGSPPSHSDLTREVRILIAMACSGLHRYRFPSSISSRS